jgi:hypothetical protein
VPAQVTCVSSRSRKRGDLKITSEGRNAPTQRHLQFPTSKPSPFVSIESTCLQCRHVFPGAQFSSMVECEKRGGWDSHHMIRLLFGFLVATSFSPFQLVSPQPKNIHYTLFRGCQFPSPGLKVSGHGSFLLLGWAGCWFRHSNIHIPLKRALLQCYT